MGAVVMEDAETGEQLYVDTGDGRLSRPVRRAARRRREALDAAFRRAGVDVLTISTEGDLVDSIVRSPRRAGSGDGVSGEGCRSAAGARDESDITRGATTRTNASAASRPARAAGGTTAQPPAAGQHIGYAMQFLWPTALLFLLFVPVLIAAYILAQRRRQRYALRYASLSLVKEALGRGPGWRRHVPPALFIAALAAMLFALARPVSVVNLPSQEGTVILLMDVSGSMRAPDLVPTRLDAAKAAAVGFVEKQPVGVRIGVVAFSDNAAVVQAPTDDREAVVAALNRLVTQRGTAIGRGLMTSVDAIFEEANAEGSAYLGPQPGAPRRRRPAGHGWRAAAGHPHTGAYRHADPHAGGKLPAGHHRAPHRRPEQPGAAAAGGGADGSGPGHPGLHRGPGDRGRRRGGQPGPVVPRPAG